MEISLSMIANKIEGKKYLNKKTKLMLMLHNKRELRFLFNKRKIKIHLRAT